MEAEPYVPLPDPDRDDWRDNAPLRCCVCRTILNKDFILWDDASMQYIGKCPEHGTTFAVTSFSDRRNETEGSDA